MKKRVSAESFINKIKKKTLFFIKCWEKSIFSLEFFDVYLISGSKPVSKDVFFWFLGFVFFSADFRPEANKLEAAIWFSANELVFGTILISHWFSHGFSAVHHIVLKISMAGPLVRLEHVGLGYIYVYI